MTYVTHFVTTIESEGMPKGLFKNLAPLINFPTCVYVCTCKGMIRTEPKQAPTCSYFGLQKEIVCLMWKVTLNEQGLRLLCYELEGLQEYSF